MTLHAAEKAVLFTAIVPKRRGETEAGLRGRAIAETWAMCRNRGNVPSELMEVRMATGDPNFKDLWINTQDCAIVLWG